MSEGLFGNPCQPKGRKGNSWSVYAAPLPVEDSDPDSVCAVRQRAAACWGHRRHFTLERVAAELSTPVVLVGGGAQASLDPISVEMRPRPSGCVRGCARNKLKGSWTARAEAEAAGAVNSKISVRPHGHHTVSVHGAGGVVYTKFTITSNLWMYYT